jgi:hypothetical protein
VQKFADIVYRLLRISVSVAIGFVLPKETYSLDWRLAIGVMLLLADTTVDEIKDLVKRR